MEKDNTFHPHGHGNDSFDVNRTTMPGARDRKPDGRFEVGDLILGRYKVLSELGQGGMGVVYKCLDETAGIEIALKALPPELSHNTLEMEDVKDNFQLVSKLVHQNIAISKNLEIDKATGNYYLIMECVAGEDLRRWIKRKRREGALTLEAVLPVVRQVAAALDYAHEEKIIHRDIKPGNIMIDAAGHVKVLDFGLAAQIHTSMTRVSMAYRGTSGTAPYMAPEQWEGDAQGAPADQYALAVMTYEMLAGRLPFESPDVSVLREAVLKGTAKPIDGIPKYAQQALDRAMSKDPAARFDSCSGFAAALEGKKGSAAKNRHGKGVAFSLASAATIFLLVGAGIMWRSEISKLVSGSKEKSTPAGRTERDNTFSKVKRDDRPRKQENAFQTTDETELKQNVYEMQSYLQQKKDRFEAEQIDRDQTFGEHLDAFTMNFNAGKQAREDKEFDVANRKFQKAKEEADWIDKNVPLREEARELISKADQSKFNRNNIGIDLTRLIEGITFDGIPLFDGKKDGDWFVAYAETENRIELAKKDYEAGRFQNAITELRDGILEQEAAAKKVLIVSIKYYIKDKNWRGEKLLAMLLKDLGEEQRARAFIIQAEEEMKKQAVEHLLSQAEQAKEKDDWKNVDTLLQQLLNVDPANAEAKKIASEAAVHFYEIGCQYDEKEDYAEAVKWYRKAAEQGHANAQYALGKCYYEGEGVTKDYAEAVKWYRKAAEQGHVHAQCVLGESYFDGHGVTTNYTEAEKWFRKAAEQGDTDAQRMLGVCYFTGRGVSKDPSEAIKWYRKAAEHGNALAQINLAMCYSYGDGGVTKDDGEAAKWYRKAAEQGNHNAQLSLGEYYEEGRGVIKDETEAVKWYRMAAEQGNSIAQYNMGNCYKNGVGVIQDYAEAVKWYRKAASSFHAAQYALGLCLANGKGVAQDFVEAAKWFRKAADQGNDNAQLSLGDCYYFGNGVAQDFVEATKWYQKAADRGNAAAQYSLGICYYKGEGVTQDNTEAIKWYRKAADQGYAEAQGALGECFAKGLAGIAKDDTEALKWFRKAAEQGDAKALCALGLHYYFGFGVAQDYVEALKWFRKAAEQGNANAQYLIGRCYYDGNGVAKDYAEAVKWFHKAAEQGYAEAQMYLGHSYKWGAGVSKDSSEALKWYRKAAEQGDAEAQINLGNCYRWGDLDVAKDEVEAVKWYRKAADQGNAVAQWYLGSCYKLGQGVEKDEAEAVKWYRKAAEQGNAKAQINLGGCYKLGQGVEKDEAEALKWYRKAAEQGDADGQFELALLYAYGRATKNEAEAVKWSRKAAEQGNEAAKTLLEDLGY